MPGGRPWRDEHSQCLPEVQHPPDPTRAPVRAGGLELPLRWRTVTTPRLRAVGATKLSEAQRRSMRIGYSHPDFPSKQMGPYRRHARSDRLEEQSRQVARFGDGEEHRVVAALGERPKHAHADARVAGGLAADLLEEPRRDVV